jgi:hypothetical protein
MNVETEAPAALRRKGGVLVIGGGPAVEPDRMIAG